ncbi:MAG TPA: aspartate kinase [Bacillota bacterium]|nr:aspartate kinase [Bacillota bacterium]
MKITVQKFGGTSLKDKKSRESVIRHIKTTLEQDQKIVVVVSAIGRYPDCYATDTLLSLVDYPNHAVTKREIDLLMSCGEIISSVVLTNELRKQNIRAYAMSGAQAGIVTTDQFMKANIKYINTTNIFHQLENHDVIVIAGFQGETINREITTIGRGGSDITAAALGVALQANLIEIYTDVLGVMTADPKIVPVAKPIKIASYLEASELAYQGAEVIHPTAIEIVMNEKVPIHIKPTFTKGKGTVITSKQIKNTYSLTRQLITSIAYRRHLTRVSIHLKKHSLIEQSKVFKVLAKHNVSVDFIFLSPTKLMFTIPNELAELTIKLLSNLSIYPTIQSNCAKVSIIGVQQKKLPQVISTAVGTLTNNGITIYQSSVHHTSVWLLIDDEHINCSINNLHNIFHYERKEVNG